MPPYVYYRNQFTPLEDAKMGVLTHALHYGTGCFDGIRGNWNEEKGQLFLFRVKEHYERLRNGCRILRINLPLTIDEMIKLTVEAVERSGYREGVYIRPLAYKSQEAIGVRLHNLEDDFLIVVTTLAAYIDNETGVRCCTSSWRRIDDTMIPARAKTTGLYVNSALAKTEAMERGFDEAIMLSMDGHVSEGSGENIFLVQEGKLITPPSSDNILIGITRQTVIELAREELGIETLERSIDRSELYICDEAFFTGTAAHVAPIIEIDERPIGNGSMGPVTRKLQEIYYKVIHGNHPKYMHWCMPVGSKVAKSS
jgi:branched-chain amino acid aminotransferase